MISPKPDGVKAGMPVITFRQKPCNRTPHLLRLKNTIISSAYQNFPVPSCLEKPPFTPIFALY